MTLLQPTYSDSPVCPGKKTKTKTKYITGLRIYMHYYRNSPDALKTGKKTPWSLCSVKHADGHHPIQMAVILNQCVCVCVCVCVCEWVSEREYCDGSGSWHSANHSSLRNYKEQRVSGNHHWSVRVHTHTHTHTHTEAEAGSIDPGYPACREDGDNERRYDKDTETERDTERKLNGRNGRDGRNKNSEVPPCSSVPLCVYCEQCCHVSKLVTLPCSHSISWSVCADWECVCTCLLSVLILSLQRQAHWSESRATQKSVALCVCVCVCVCVSWSSVSQFFQCVNTEFQCEVNSTWRNRERDHLSLRRLLHSAAEH